MGDNQLTDIGIKIFDFPFFFPHRLRPSLCLEILNSLIVIANLGDPSPCRESVAVWSTGRKEKKKEGRGEK